MNTQDTTATVEIHDNTCGAIPVSWWDWPDEARLADFAGQDVRAGTDDPVKRADKPLEDDAAYASLYFGS